MRTPRRLHSASMRRPATREVPIGRQGPKREVGAIAVILQIKHPREAWGRVSRITPEAVLLLGADEVLDAMPNGAGPHLPRCQQAQNRPRGLVRIAGRLFRRSRLPTVAVVAFAPTPVIILTIHQPADTSLHTLVVRPEAGLSESCQHRPGTINVIGAPTTEPRAIGHLLFEQKVDRFCFCFLFLCLFVLFL